MYTIKKFFCTNLANGTIAIGWFFIVHSIITAVVCMLQAILNALIWYTNLGVGTGFLLILAVKHRSDILLLPWLIVNAFHIVIAIPILQIFLIWNYISEPGFLFGALICLTLLTLLIAYGWVGVYSLYRLYKNEEQYGTSSRTYRKV